MTTSRILLISEGQLGDLLLLTPALRGLRSAFPDSHVTLLVVQRRTYASGGEAPPVLVVDPVRGTAAALRNLPYVDQVLEVSRQSLRALRGFPRLRAEWRILRTIRSGRFTTAIACFPEDRFALWARASGATCRVGQKRQHLQLLFSSRPDVTKEGVGVLRYYAALAGAAGAAVADERTEFPVSEEARLTALMTLASHGIGRGEKFALIHPGASGLHRIWPPERFASVIDNLEKDRKILPVLCGTPYDRVAVEAVARRVPRPLRVITLGDSVEEFAALLGHAVFLLSNDSGPRHLAVAVGVPSVAIMPKHNERAWGIYGEENAIALTARGECAGCPATRCLDERPEGEEFGSRCIRMVEVEEVLEAIERTMRRRATFAPPGTGRTSSGWPDRSS